MDTFSRADGYLASVATENISAVGTSHKHYSTILRLNKFSLALISPVWKTGALRLLHVSTVQSRNWIARKPVG